MARQKLPEIGELSAYVRMEPQQDSGEKLSEFLKGAGIPEVLIKRKVDPTATYAWFAILEAISFEKKHAILDAFNPREDKYFSSEAATPDGETVRFYWRATSQETLPEIKYEASLSQKERREQKRTRRLEEKMAKKSRRKNSSEDAEIVS